MQRVFRCSLAGALPLLQRTVPSSMLQMRICKSFSSANVDASEIDKFSRLAAGWWDPHGDSAPLHAMNPVRMAYIRSRVEQTRTRFVHAHEAPFANVSALDVGCGGGLASEALARLGAEVTGIDLAKANIRIAQEHAKLDPRVDSKVQYLNVAAEDIVAAGRSFDIVTCLEVIEHVPNMSQLVRTLADLVKPGGHLFLSSINRTWKSYLLAIGAAEYILRLVPVGTHDWSRFVTPSELSGALLSAGMQVEHSSGMFYNPLLRSWSLMSSDLDVNYILHATKPAIANFAPLTSEAPVNASGPAAAAASAKASSAGGSAPFCSTSNVKHAVVTPPASSTSAS